MVSLVVSLVVSLGKNIIPEVPPKKQARKNKKIGMGDPLDLPKTAFRLHENIIFTGAIE